MAGSPPDGYHSVTTRIVVDDAEGLVDFLEHTFDARADVVPGGPTEVRIGDSLVIVGRSGPRATFPAFLYVYVEDADAACSRALEAGAETIEAPFDTPYGDRRGMVADPFGNVLQIAHRVEGRHP